MSAATSGPWPTNPSTIDRDNDEDGTAEGASVAAGEAIWTRPWEGDSALSPPALCSSSCSSCGRTGCSAGAASSGSAAVGPAPAKRAVVGRCDHGSIGRVSPVRLESASVSRGTHSRSPAQGVGFSGRAPVASSNQTAQQVQPNAPQKALKSLTATRLGHALAWSWPWMPQRRGQPQAEASLRMVAALLVVGGLAHAA